MSNEFEIMAEFGVGGRFMAVLGFRKQFLSITNDCQTNYLTNCIALGEVSYETFYEGFEQIDKYIF